MKTYDLYGYDDQDIESARQAIQDAFGIVLKAHESSYHCGAYYRLGDIGTEHFILQRNYDDFEKEWTEDAFQKYPLFLRFVLLGVGRLPPRMYIAPATRGHVRLH